MNNINQELLDAIEALIEASTAEVAPDGYRVLRTPSQAAIRRALEAIKLAKDAA